MAYAAGDDRISRILSPRNDEATTIPLCAILTMINENEDNVISLSNSVRVKLFMQQYQKALYVVLIIPFLSIVIITPQTNKEALQTSCKFNNQSHRNTDKLLNNKLAAPAFCCWCRAFCL
jgi:hypothetical protein